MTYPALNPGWVAQKQATGTPEAPTNVTSIMADGAATVSWVDPGPPATSYTVTPYIAGAPQSTATVGAPATTAGVTGLTNGTAYTFTVHASNAAGSSLESAQSGANTPRTGLVFGDDFNGTVLDPEWFVYNRCGYIAQNEIEWYLPSQCVLDGSGNLTLVAVNTPHSGPSYPSDGNTVRNQTWISGACQSNTRSYAPAANGNTMTFETRFQVPPQISGGMWPGLLWLEGTDYLTAWKTDPNQASWNTTGKAEIDIAEFGSPGQTSPGRSTTSFLSNLSTSGAFIPEGGSGHSGATDFSAGMHIFSATWKGTSAQSTRAVNWYLDAPYVAGTGPSGGTQVASLSNSAAIPVQSSCSLFLLLYLQIIAGSASATQQCTIDYVRVYDQNLG